MGLVMYLKRDAFLQSEEFLAYQRGLQREIGVAGICPAGRDERRVSRHLSGR